jgi:CheY-like chemotaxis protein
LKCYEAADGVEALTLFKQHVVDNIIMDIVMPHDGITTTKVRERQEGGERRGRREEGRGKRVKCRGEESMER